MQDLGRRANWFFGLCAAAALAGCFGKAHDLSSTDGGWDGAAEVNGSVPTGGRDAAARDGIDASAGAGGRSTGAIDAPQETGGSIDASGGAGGTTSAVGTDTSLTGGQGGAPATSLGTITGTATGTAATTSTGIASGTASSLGSGTGIATASGTTATGTGTVTGTGGGNTVATTGTGTTTRTGNLTGSGTGTGTVATSTGTGTGTVATSTGTGTGTVATSTGTGTGTVATSTGSGTGTGTTGTGTGTGTGAGKTAGISCGGTGECQAGLTCLDGVCCTQSSCPECRNCGTGGTCTITVSSAEDTTGTACMGASVCNAAGACKMKNGGGCTPTGGECATGTCVDDHCCSQSCGTCQACTGTGGTCVAVLGADDPDTCTGTNTCNAVGACKKKNGEGCRPADGDCATGLCVDEHCCSQSCGPCQACTGAGGTCVAVVSADDPDSCTGTSTCNATGACKKRDGQACEAASECLSNSCNNRNLCGPSVRCVGLAAACGPSGSGDCCASAQVPGGTFYRGYNGVDYNSTAYPATVSDFYLDKYEITVGRFRQFVETGMGTQAKPPAAGAGLHPLIANSGWNSAWNTILAASTATLKSGLKCEPDWRTWTDQPGANENRPINCVDWYTAFAFCAWDGGRLATDAEWNFAASGGSEQRYYPWSNPATSTTISPSYASYWADDTQQCMGDGVVGCTVADFVVVGSKPNGNGKWGHADLAGNVAEWTLDWQALFANPCSNCANLTPGTFRSMWGGHFGMPTSGLLSAARNSYPPDVRQPSLGIRCARTSL